MWGRWGSAWLRVFGGAMVLLLPGCMASPGYRDQVYHALDAAPETKQTPGLGPDAVREDEWLSGYRFALPAPVSGTPYAVIGATAEEQARGQAWLMLAVAVGSEQGAERPSRRWLYVLDAGEGMQGERWRLAVRGALRLSQQLSARDYIRIVEAGARRKVESPWRPAGDAGIELERRLAGPVGGFGKDGAIVAEVLEDPLVRDEQAGAERSATTSVFFFTDGTGSERMTWRLFSKSQREQPDVMALKNNQWRHAGREEEDGYSRRGIGNFNVIGVPGGDETSLRNFARAAGGSYVFLASEWDIHRYLGARSAELFEVRLKKVRVGLESVTAKEPARTGDTAQVERRKQLWEIPARQGEIGRMGAGEVWVRLYPVRQDEIAGIAGRRLVVRGEDAWGKPVRRACAVTQIGLDAQRLVSPEAKALWKARLVHEQVRVLQKVLTKEEVASGAWRVGLDDLLAQLRIGQKVLNDPELARDLREWEAIAQIRPEEIRRLQREWPLSLTAGQQLKRGAATAGVASGIVVGGTALVAVGLPCLFLYALVHA